MASKTTSAEQTADKSKGRSQENLEEVIEKCTDQFLASAVCFFTDWLDGSFSKPQFLQKFLATLPNAFQSFAEPSFRKDAADLLKEAVQAVVAAPADEAKKEAWRMACKQLKNSTEKRLKSAATGLDESSNSSQINCSYALNYFESLCYAYSDRVPPSDISKSVVDGKSHIENVPSSKVVLEASSVAGCSGPPRQAFHEKEPRPDQGAATTIPASIVSPPQYGHDYLMHRPVEVFCKSHFKDKTITSEAGEREVKTAGIASLVECIKNQVVLTKKCLMARCLCLSDMDEHWHSSGIKILLLKSAYESKHAPSDYIIVKNRQTQWRLEGCGNCEVGNLVLGIREKLVSHLRDLSVEGVVALEELLFTEELKKSQDSKDQPVVFRRDSSVSDLSSKCLQVLKVQCNFNVEKVRKALSELQLKMAHCITSAASDPVLKPHVSQLGNPDVLGNLLNI